MAVQPIPPGMHTVTPHLVVRGAAKAIDFYKRAFDAKEESRLPGPNGTLMHASIRIGDSSVMLMDESPEWKSVGPQSLKGTPVTIHLYVNDVDKTFDTAVKAGAKPVMPVSDMFWGDRYGVLEDPFGHSWSVATHKRDVSDKEMQEAMKRGPM
jgi:PhnB protein